MLVCFIPFYITRYFNLLPRSKYAYVAPSRLYPYLDYTLDPWKSNDTA